MASLTGERAVSHDEIPASTEDPIVTVAREDTIAHHQGVAPGTDACMVIGYEATTANGRAAVVN